jgi:Putative beta-barrel porin 2
MSMFRVHARPQNTAIRAITAAVAFVALVAPAFAQSTNSEPPANARVRVGPLAVKPSVALTNVGIDSNVFNEAQNPKRDVTATIEPQIETWLRLGAGRLHTRSRSGIVYFQQYHGERSVNADHQARLEFLFNRVRPFVEASFLDSRLRPGYEIDTRARREETAVTAGGRIRLIGATWLDIAAHRSRVAFDADATFFGTHVRDVLNRDVDRVTASVRYPLTPYTTIVMRADTQRDRFELSPVRDAKSLRILPGVEFDSRAAISGRAFVGYHRFDAFSADVPSYRGLNASVDLTYIVHRSTKFSVRAERDVEYSMERVQPYFLATDVSGSITQALFRPWDVQVTWGRQQLDYVDAGSPTNEPGRIDRVRTYGAGIGYRISSDTRVGVDVSYYRRASDHEGRQYETLRAGTSVTYGF